MKSDPVDYSPSAAAASAAQEAATDPPSISKREMLMMEKRTDCAAQPAGAGPVTSPDTDSAFLANTNYDVSYQGPH